MKGMIMDYQLTVPKLLQRSAKIFAHKEIVSAGTEGKTVIDWGGFYERVLKAMEVLRGLGVKRGDRVATFSWNDQRHLELYFAIPCLGAVLHTVNVRLFPEQLVYIINHAEDSVLFVDESLLEPIQKLAPQLRTVREYVVLSPADAPLQTTLTPAHHYETLLAGAEAREDFPRLDERDAAGLCYTSGTTGEPKGVLYSHRGNYLVAMMSGMTDAFALSERDVVLPVVPMFHANAWSIPYTCALVGSKLVLPGGNLQPEHLVSLIQEEEVSFALGVPTIWNGMLKYLRDSGKRIDSIRAMLVGGSAVPAALIEAYAQEFSVEIIQAWGMTEMSPLGSVTRLTSKMADWPQEQKMSVLAKAGLPFPAVNLKIVDDTDRELPWDGEAQGELLVRGVAVADGYFNNPEASTAAMTADGWFRTGDVATIDEHGMLHIADRTKDLIKSGGEWISSVEMENALMACPGVFEAAVVARPDPRWDERPVAFVVTGEGDLQAVQLLNYLTEHFAKWQLPALEDIRFVDAIPRTSVGKFDKKVLREALG